jgi:hypothetical protein
MNSFYFKHLPMSFAETWISKEREIPMVYYVILMISTYELTEWNLKIKTSFIHFSRRMEQCSRWKIKPTPTFVLKRIKEPRTKKQATT